VTSLSRGTTRSPALLPAGHHAVRTAPNATGRCSAAADTSAPWAAPERARRQLAPPLDAIAPAWVRAVSSCARHRTYANSPGLAQYDWRVASSSIASRCAISAWLAQPAKGDEQRENYRSGWHAQPRIESPANLAHQISSVPRTDGRRGSAFTKLPACRARNRPWPPCVFPTSSPIDSSRKINLPIDVISI